MAIHSAKRRWQFFTKHSFIFLLLSLLLASDISIGCSGEQEPTEQTQSTQPIQAEPAPVPESFGQEQPASVAQPLVPPEEEPLAMTKPDEQPAVEPAPQIAMTDKAIAQTQPAKSDESAALSAHVTATALNVRSGPGTKNRVVGILLKYDPVTITDRRRLSKSTWYNIDAAGGYVDGWVSGAYLALSPPPSGVEIQEVDYGAKETPTLVKGSFKYVGVTVCKECHVESTGKFPKGAFTVWNGHFHSEAFRSLSRNYTREIARRVRGIDDPAKDWRCVKCHVTAYGADASQVAETYRDTDGVGCEVCHGPGSAYAEADHGPSNPDRYALGFYKLDNLEAREAVCRSCHNPTSPTYKPFNILAFSREIRHWADPDDATYFEHAQHVGREREKKVAALNTPAAQGGQPVVPTDSAAAEAQAKAEQMKQEAEAQAQAEAAKAEQMKQEAEAQAQAEAAKAEQMKQEAETQAQAEAAKAEQMKQEAETQAQAAAKAEQMRRELEEKARAEEAERKTQEALERKKAEEQAEAERQKKAAEEAAKAAAAAASGVERHLAGLAATFTLNPNGEKYQTVRFTHSAHADKNYVAGIQCQTCHHTQEGDDKPEKCSNCHDVDGDAGETKLKTNATHSKAHPFPKESADQEQVSCIGCHKAQNSLLEAGRRSGKQAPTKCTGCHKKKST